MHVARVFTRRTAVAVAALGAVAAATLPAGATTSTTTPSHGRATSTLTILKLKVAGQSVTAGRISAVAGTVSAHTAALSLTPLAYNFPAVGQSGTLGKQTITPSSGTVTVPDPPVSIALPGGIGSVTGPSFVAQAKKTATAVLASADLAALGKVTLAGVPLNLHLASLSDIAQVVSSNATADKSFSLGDLSLPTLSQLLAALGLDLTKTLDELTQGKLTQLAGLVTTTTSGAVKTANDAVDTAQAGVTTAGGVPAATLTAAQAQLATAQSDATTANDAFDSAWTTAYGALGPAQAALDAALTTAGLTAPLTAAQFNDAVLNDPTLLAAFQAAFGATETTLESLAAAAVAADALASAVNDLVDALQNLVDTVLGAINADSDPIASLGGIKLTTKAVAAGTPKANAALSVASIDVLGQASSLSALTGAVATVGSTLASVLNSVPGVTFAPLSIAVGKPAHSTKTVGTTRYAAASVTGVALTLPTLTLSGAALPLALPGGLNSASGALVLGELDEAAQWTPAVSHTSTTPGSTGGPQLSETGGTVMLPILAVVLLGLAVVVRRRWSGA